MNVADKLVQILEENGVKYIFGLPGEQILPFYKSLSDSSINHVLVRHEQSAVHAADGYRRSSNKLGVCVSTASPGALNFMMGAATAYKDHVPILLITGDNSTDIKFSDNFQSFPLHETFSTVTFKSYDPKTGSEAIANLIEIMQIFQREPCGPIHLNLSKNILLEDDYKIAEINYEPMYEYGEIEEACKKIENSKKPVFIFGSGARDSGFEKLALESNVPICTTFSARGIVSENERINLGLVGNRGNARNKYALANSDCVIAIGTRLSERTLLDDSILDKLIDVNIDKSSLKGDIQIHMDCAVFAKEVILPNSSKWLDEILNIKLTDVVDGVDDESLPLRPPSAISSILKGAGDSIIAADAGSHITWTMLLSKCMRPSQLLFSGGIAPMGYGLPGAIGASFATGENIVLINGDGDIQMNMQELAILKEYNLPICVCILNNSSLYLIKGTERNVYDMEPFAVDFVNPDFVKIAEAYGIDSKRITEKNDVEKEVLKAVKSSKPVVLEIIVRQEDIPLPKPQ